MQALARLLAASLLLLAFPTDAAFRAYLATTGVDNPTCGSGSPCRLLSAAMAAVNDGGEIWILDSGNFNLVIKQLTGFGSTHGVFANSGTSLSIERCTIADMPNNGLSIHTALFVRISDTVFRGNGTGINLDSGPSASLTRVTFASNTGYGLNAAAFGGVIPADIRDSVFTGNGGNGINATGGGTGTVSIALATSQLSRNANGIAIISSGSGRVNLTATGNVIANNVGDGLNASGAQANAIISDNTIMGNAANGINNVSGSVLTTNTNVVRQNGTDTAGNVFGISKS